MSAWSAPACDFAALSSDTASRGRRGFALHCSALAVMACGGLTWPTASRAAGEEFAFAATTVQEALQALGGVQAQGPEVVLSLPDSAENGALVPVTVSCQLQQVTEIFLVVEHNPNPLVVRFSISPGTEPYVATRIKMAESSQVHAWVRAGDRLYAAHRHTQVATGGCG